jgi:hypothetical protein
MARTRHVAAAGAAGLALLVVLVWLALASAPRAGAVGEPGFGCGHVHRGKARHNPNPRGKPPLAIGDSTMLLPIPNLIRVGYDVDARGCRGFGESIEVMRRKKKKGLLPHLVLDAAYSNGIDEKLIASALNVLGPSRVLVLVTEYNANTGEAPAPDTDILFAAAQQYPHQVAVLDWVNRSLSHHSTKGWFLPDLFHPNFDGAKAYARFLKRALSLARNGRFPS